MKLGIVGSGMIVHDLLPVFVELPEITLAAIYGREKSLAKLEDLQHQYNIQKVHTDFSAFLNDDTIDTVYVALPNHLHFEYTKRALEHGKHVICEKPFTSNAKELQILVDLAKEKDLFLLEAITNQYIKNFLEIKKRVGRLGKIKIVEANYSQYSSRYDAFKAGNILPAFNREMSGGALMDLNIYNIHFVVGLFGAPKDVFYYANIEKGIDTSGILAMDYGDFKAVCIGSKDSKAPISANVQGDAGTIHVNGTVSVCDSFEFLPNNGEDEHVDVKDSEHRMYDEFAAFARIITEQDKEEMLRRLDHSLVVMDVVTKAKATAGLVFLADEK
ncbi:Gfo/Idh/MocA family protein [Listeria fleischmannii]|uniref:Gfo/Idh/MocA family protein n=1 Tax=Listeria fleischmannii TaxID=1069827 RepID=UPI001629567E|nr:Gfo/Idh/MocA family oxidoreductase [Listeria fleischmannii]MBC1419166.1 Gfo/Idh/MocA family oxidoreductase [Listeria fleischmannii]